MYCNHCGKENQEGSKICGYCGLEIQRTEDAIIPAPVVNNNSKINTDKIKEKIAGVASDADTGKIDKKKIALFGGIGAGVVAVAVTLIVILTSVVGKVSLKDYIAEELIYTGINGYGSVETGELVDWNALSEDIGKKKAHKASFDDVDDFDDLEELFYYDSISINDFIDYECTSENNGQLSNGDTVEYTFHINKEAIKKSKLFKKNIKGDEDQTFKFTVSGLEEGTTIDVFDAVENVTIDEKAWGYNRSVKLKADYAKDYGVNGINVKNEDGSLRVYGDNFESFSIYFNLVSDNINENTKTVKVSTNNEADEYRSYGIILSATEADVTINRVDYLKKNTINKDDLAKLTEKAKKYANENADGKKITLEKVALYIEKKEDGGDSLGYFFKMENKYYLVYFDNFKENSDHSIVDVDKLNPGSWMTLVSYNSIQEAVEDTYKDYTEYALNVK